MSTDAGVERYEQIVELRALIACATGRLRRDPTRRVLVRVQRDLVDVARDVLVPGAHVGADRVVWLMRACEETRRALAPGAQPALSEASNWLLLGSATARAAACAVRGESQRRPVNPLALDYLDELAELLYLFARTVGVVPETRPRRRPRSSRGRVAAHPLLPAAPIAV